METKCFLYVRKSTEIVPLEACVASELWQQTAEKLLI